MERTPEEHQGFVNSVLNLAWSVGWAVGPFISGLVQQQYGFAPLFIATAVLYGLACLLIWLLFARSESGGAVSQPVLRSPEHPE
jgi:predicted MFS family arabinose efflux permease